MTDQKRLTENVAALINEAEDLMEMQPNGENFSKRELALDAQHLLRTAAPHLIRIDDTVVSKALTNWHARVANIVGQELVA
jgi:hypothetical protein